MADLMTSVVSQVDNPPSHAVIILASGLSQRLGQPKQLLKIQSQPLLEVMVNLALVNSPKAIVLVIPDSLNEIVQLAQTLSIQYDVVEPILNSHPERGMAHSLSLAINDLASQVEQGLDIERILILGVDQVLLEATHLRQLLAGGDSTQDSNKNAVCRKVIASGYFKSYTALEGSLSNASIKFPDDEQSIIGLPINIDYELLKKWQPTLAGDKGLRHLIRSLTSHDLSVIESPKLSLDIDTPEQLEFARQKGWLD